MPTVSAVIPVHNGAEYVAEAISSVLAQTCAPLECIVIDDGSTDATPKVAATFGSDVRYIRLDRGGQSRARNHGTHVARGDLVAFLDHDDVWLPAKLEVQLGALEGSRYMPMALCAVEVIDPRGVTLGAVGLGPRENLITGMLTFDGTETISCNSAGVMRREWLLDNGGYDPVLSISGDWDLLLRTLLDHEVAYVDEPLVRYRLHGSNLHRNVAVTERDMLYAFAKAFADPRLPETVRSRRRYAYSRLYRMLAGSYHTVGDQNATIRSLAMAVLYDPMVALDPLVQRLSRTSRSPA